MGKGQLAQLEAKGPLVEGMGTPLVEGMGRPLVEGMGTPLVEGMGTPLVEGMGTPLVEEMEIPLVEGMERLLVRLASRQSMATPAFRRTEVRPRLGHSQHPLSGQPSLGHTLRAMLGPAPGRPAKSTMGARFHLCIHSIHTHFFLSFFSPLILPFSLIAPL